VVGASVEVSGPDAERWAGELRGKLAAQSAAGDSVASVEVDRSAELVIAIIGLAFSGVSTAKTIWDWWHERRSEGVRVRILLDDGSQVELSGVEADELQVAIERRVKAQN
jgi:hypothetical protein